MTTHDDHTAATGRSTGADERARRPETTEIDASTRVAAAREATSTRRSFLAATGAATAGVAAGVTGAAAQSEELNAVTFDLSNLPDLGDGAYYEGWAIYDDEKVSTGVFSKGQEYVFGVSRDLSAANALAITIEPDDEAGGPPSGIAVLKGELSDGTAELSFPIDFSESSGSFLLNTPTASEAPDDSGVWFLEPDPEGEGHVASLDVPSLADVPGWTYEGWVVVDGQPVTTGRFDDPAMADDAAPYSGDGDAPPFPGEDLVQNAPEDLGFPRHLALGDSKVVLSVEPDLDGTDPTGAAPFQVKPLAGEITEGLDAGTPQDLPRNDGTLPSGSATLHRNVDAARGNTDQQNAVAFDLTMLPDLGEDAYYEGWAIYDDEKVSTGVFSTGQEYVFGVDRDLSAANAIAITIEPDDEAGGPPSGIAILKGEVSDGTAELSFPLDLSDSSGSFLLNTPTAPDAAATAGVWFLQPNPDGEGKVASLDLPSLADVPGWTYEGWAVTQGTPISTGRFDDPAMADDAAPYSGDGSAPPFPGEDLVANAPEGVEFPADLTDGSSKVVVSVEPDLDGSDPTGDGPFQVKPLAGEVPADLGGGTPQSLSHNDGTLPSGTATLHDDVAAAREDGVQDDEHNAVALTVSNLPELGDGAYYEGWAIYDDEKLSTGVFSTGDEYVFETGRDLLEANAIAITVEPDDEAGGPPSGIAVLKGELHGRSADLEFPVSLGDAAGSYLLNTPTAPDAAATAGLWFLEPNPDGEGKVASLDLPDLSDVAGWTYEGWAVTQGTPVSTGRFDDPAMADDSAPYSGDASAPPFPGEDLVANAPDGVEFPADLTDGSSKAVVTVEPDHDGMDPTGDGPFPIKPLVADVPADLGGGTPQDLAQNEGTVPSGAATLYRDAETARDARGGRMDLTLQLEDLPELGGDAAYEGWAILGDEKVSTGTFSTGGEHEMALDRDPSAVEKVAITIEPDAEAGGSPSGVVLLAGPVDDGAAELSSPLPGFDDASGSYLLNTPTAPLVSAESGVWFLQPNPDGEGHVASLDLPELPDGWVYEGWVVHGEMPITTGRFDDPTMGDDAAPYSDTDGTTPPFPGEDFVTNEPAEELVFPTDLTDGATKVVVSVEPDVDGTDPTGPSPFAIKPLAASVPADAEGATSYDLESRDVTLPSGTAIVSDGAPGAIQIGDVVARDADGDGLYQDFNNDGRVSHADVNGFFDHFYYPAAKDRPVYFDYNGNGVVGHGDVLELFRAAATL